MQTQTRPMARSTRHGSTYGSVFRLPMTNVAHIGPPPSRARNASRHSNIRHTGRLDHGGPDRYTPRASISRLDHYSRSILCELHQVPHRGHYSARDGVRHCRETYSRP